MKISVPLINGMLADEYGKYAPANLMLADHPIKSFPIEISEALPKQRHLPSFLLIMIPHQFVGLPGFIG